MPESTLPIKIISERSQLREAIEFCRACLRDGYLRDERVIREIAAVAALDEETATAEQFEAIRGYNPLTVCDVCREKKPDMVHFGPEPDYEVTCMDICGGCLRAGMDMLQAHIARVGSNA